MLSCHANDGFYVLDVDKNGVSALAGVLAGDIIYQMDDVPINSYLDLRNYLYSKNIGDIVNVKLYRSGAPIELELALGEKK